MTTLPLSEAGYDRIPNGLPSVQPSPGEEQRGRAAQAMKSAEAALAQQLSSTAEFDRQIVEALRHAHKTTVEGRRRLDDLEAEIVGAAQGWDLGTAAGAREFQRFLIAKLSEIVRVVEEANDDDTSKRALAAALTALYATPADRDTAAPAERQPERPDDPALAATGGDEEAYLDPLSDDEPEAGYSLSPQRPAEAPTLPMVPGLGGEGPGFGAMPAAMPAGFPSAGLLPEPDGGEAAAGDELEPAEPTPADAAVDDDKADADAAPETGHDKSSVTVTLPDGATTTVADPRLAAAMQAAADGTPVAEAFRRQGIDIPPPGIPVTAPVDQAGLRPGDIGVFTDRHAVAVGDGKALLDGQVHLAGNLRGPGFLGWQHLRVGESTSTGEPAPTRPAGLLPAPTNLNIRVSPVIVD